MRGIRGAFCESSSLEQKARRPDPRVGDGGGGGDDDDDGGGGGELLSMGMSPGAAFVSRHF